MALQNADFLLTADNGKFVTSVVDAETKFKKSWRDMEGEARKRSRSIVGVTDKIGAAAKRLLNPYILATAAVAALGKATQATFESADKLLKTSERIGFDVEEIQSLNFAAGQLSGTTDGLEKILEKFTKRIGETAAGIGSAKKEYDRLGISVTTADGSIRGSMDVLREYSGVLKNMTTDAERNASVSQTMSDESRKFLQLMAAGEEVLNQYAERLREIGGLLTKDELKVAAVLNDEFDELSRTVKTKVQKEILQTATDFVTLRKKAAAFFDDLEKRLPGLKLALNPEIYSAFFKALTGRTDVEAEILSTVDAAEAAKKKQQQINRDAEAVRRKLSERIKGIHVDETKVIKAQVDEQTKLLNTQKRKLAESVTSIEAVQKAMSDAMIEVTAGPGKAGPADYGDVLGVTSEARKALQAGDLDKAISLSEKGIKVVRELKNQGDLSGLQARGALKELDKILVPAAEKRKAEREAELAAAQAQLDQFKFEMEALKKIEIGVDDVSLNATAQKIKAAIEGQLKAIKIDGVGLSNVDAANNILKPYKDLPAPPAKVTDLGRVVIEVPGGSAIPVEGDPETLNKFVKAMELGLARAASAASG